MALVETQSETKYKNVAEHFRKLIASHALNQGDQLPSFAAVRREFGIGQATYDQAQRLLERDGLVYRRPGRGIFVAKRTTTSSAGHIAVAGVSLSSIGDGGYWRQVFDGIRDAAQSERKSVLVLSHADQYTDWAGISGVVLVAAIEIQTPLPCVSILCQVPGCMAILADEGAGVRDAMVHLTELGHSRIAFLQQGATATPVPGERLYAYRNGLMDVGVIPDPLWVRHLVTSTRSGFYFYGLETMTKWLSEDWKDLGCTAILTQNDEAARGVIDALANFGYSVPGDISVVGFDGILADNDRESGITTVVMPLFELGRAAVKQLRVETKGINGLVSHKLGAPLRVGTTTGPCPAR